MSKHLKMDFKEKYYTANHLPKETELEVPYLWEVQKEESHKFCHISDQEKVISRGGWRKYC